jgi:NitT/TauT family transport system ATP-binding protein
MLQVDHLRKAYGPVEAIADLAFEVRANELVTVVGPSGCGKTTLLKCMAGLLEPSAGGVHLYGEQITRPPATMAPVFQDYSRSLFPWMTVRHNVAFPLRRKRLDRRAVRAAVEGALEAVDLTRVLDRYPWQLSGGMQQRVAIARALAYQPEMLLMDEPFASVDAQTRADLEDLILLLRDEYGVTVVFVTHDIDEAVYLGDRILILTPAPATLQQALEIDLPQPRDQVATKQQPEFARLRAHIYRSIKAKGGEHGIPRALAAPAHGHQREDEHSSVVEGRVGARDGDGSAAELSRGHGLER